MTARVWIFCNGVIPSAGIPSGAQGLRALGLYRTLEAAGIRADILGNAEMVHRQIDKWGAEYVRIPSYWRVMPGHQIEKALNRDYSTVIIQNWPGLPEFRPRKGVRLIYDFFSATMVEHSFIVDAATLARRREQKVKLLSAAEVFIANGVGRAEYGKAFLKGCGMGERDVASIPIAMERGAETMPLDGKFKIFSGGFDQPWNKGLSVEDLQAMAIALDAEVHTIGMGLNTNLPTDETRIKSLSTAATLGHVVAHPAGGTVSYNRINSKCHVGLDVFQRNAEREVSYSTRAIASLSSGCPLITMSFTEIGKIVAEMDAGWVLDTFSTEAVIGLLEHLKENPAEVAHKRGNTFAFWDKFVNPKAHSETLSSLIQ